MAKKHVLVADGDPKSSRVVDVALKNAGYTVTVVRDGEAALGVLHDGAADGGTPRGVDAMVVDARLPKLDGLALVKILRATPGLAATTVLLLTVARATEDNLRGLELGVDEFVAKPVFLTDLLAKVEVALARGARVGLGVQSMPDGATLRGSAGPLGVIDLLQGLETAKRSGTLTLRLVAGPADTGRGVAEPKRLDDDEATVLLRSGRVIDARYRALRGEEALYRTMVWREVGYEITFGNVEGEDILGQATNHLVHEGLRRLDEWSRLSETLPPLDRRFRVDEEALASKIPEIPPELAGVLKLVDGARTLLGIVDASPFEDLSTLSTLSQLYFEGVLVAMPPLSSRAPQSGADFPRAPVEEKLAPPRPSGTVRPPVVAASGLTSETMPFPPPPEVQAVLAEIRQPTPSASAPPRTTSKTDPFPAMLPTPGIPVEALVAPPSEPAVGRASISGMEALREEDDGAAADGEPDVLRTSAPGAPSEDAASDPDAAPSDPVPAIRSSAPPAGPRFDPDDELDDDAPRGREPGGDRIAGNKVVLGLFAALAVFATFGIAARKIVRGNNDSPEGLGVVGAVSGGWDAPTKKDGGAPVLTVPPTVGVSAASAPSASATAGPSAAPEASASAAASAAPDAGPPKPKLSKDAIGRAIDAGKYDDAIAAAQALVDATPTDAEAWLLLGAAYDGKRDKTAARAAYKSCTEQAKGTFANECARMLR